MTEKTPQRSPVQKLLLARRLCICVGCIGLAFNGCSARKNPATWRNAAQIRPELPLPQPRGPDEADPVPELRLELPPPPAPLAVHYVPARPHVAPSPSGEVTGVSKPDVPIISPQLPAEETAAAQQEVASSLGVAEKNLALAKGRSLNPTQLDLASKIKGFIGDARAAAASDWTRARTLAKKAQVLSEELAASL